MTGSGNAPWFAMFDQYVVGRDDVPDHVRRFWMLAEKVDKDPAWVAWWGPSPYDRLTVGVYGSPDDYVRLDTTGNDLNAEVGSATIDAWAGEMDERERHVDGGAVDEIEQLVRAELRTVLERIGERCDLGSPPEFPEG